MEPDIQDSQGDFHSREEIQKACDHFAKHGLVGKCDVNHNMQPVPEFTVVDTYNTPEWQILLTHISLTKITLAALGC